jgi:hypothetical protein
MKILKIFNDKMPIDEKVFLFFRIPIVLCFVGHGAFGFITEDGKMGKVAWLTFYRIFGFEPDLVYKFMLMPLVGMIDFFIAFMVIVVPTRGVFAWATFWCFFTALLRPVSGQGLSEFFERGGNYGLPLALLVYCGLNFRSFKDCFSPIDPPNIKPDNVEKAILILKFAIAFLLIGHGGFFIFDENNQREYLLQHWASVGIVLTPMSILLMGWFEVGLGMLVFFKPSRHLLVLIIVWKVFSESLYFISGVPNGYIWEWLERSGDYWAPPILMILMQCRKKWPKQNIVGISC